VGVLVLLAGCQEKEITTYRIPKEQLNPAAETDHAGHAHSRGIAWETPKGWSELPPSAMRVGSFLITGANEQKADVSVIPLSGGAGGILANINRWRGQIGLEPIESTTLPQSSQTIQPGGRKMLLVDFVSPTPLMENRYKKRIMAAIYARGQTTWFFKMTGEDETVRSAKPAFLRFLESLRFPCDE